MAEYVEKLHVERDPSDTVVVHDHNHDDQSHSNPAVVVALIIIGLILLFLLLGRSFIGGRGGGTNINVSPQVPTGGGGGTPGQ